MMMKNFLVIYCFSILVTALAYSSPVGRSVGGSRLISLTQGDSALSDLLNPHFKTRGLPHIHLIKLTVCSRIETKLRVVEPSLQSAYWHEENAQKWKVKLRRFWLHSIIVSWSDHIRGWNILLVSNINKCRLFSANSKQNSSHTNVVVSPQLWAPIIGHSIQSDPRTTEIKL